MMSVVIPGIYDENECHKLAIKINAPKHACFEYRIAVSHADVADAVQDELQDQGVIGSHNDPRSFMGPTSDRRAYGRYGQRADGR